MLLVLLKDGVVNGVEDGIEIKLEENGEGIRVRGKQEVICYFE